jgi:hypothetical protein
VLAPSWAVGGAHLCFPSSDVSGVHRSGAQLPARVYSLPRSPSGFFARLLPFGLDGRAAAFTLRGNRRDAGAAMMQAQSPDAWHALMDVLLRCRTVGYN